MPSSELLCSPETPLSGSPVCSLCDVSDDVVFFFPDSLAGHDFAVTWKLYRRWSCHQQACGLKRHVAISWYHGYMICITFHYICIYRRCLVSASKAFRHQRFFQNPTSPGVILQNFWSIKPKGREFFFWSPLCGVQLFILLWSRRNCGWILLKVLGLVFLVNKHHIHWCGWWLI